MFLREIIFNIPNSNLYPFNLPWLAGTKSLEFTKSVTFVTGKNGTGKSTLIEAIANKYNMNLEGGGRDFNFTTKATHSDLFNYVSIVKGIKLPKDYFFLRAETLYSLLSNIDQVYEDEINHSSVHKASHGEGLLNIVSRFKGGGLYILDEPESALSVHTQMQLMVIIKQLVALGSQFIISTHSPILICYPDAEIYNLDGDEVTTIDYSESEQFYLTKAFLNNPDKTLNELFS